MTHDGAHCFFFNDTATTEIYTLSLHDALPICRLLKDAPAPHKMVQSPDGRLWLLHRTGLSELALSPNRLAIEERRRFRWGEDRKSTRLNSSHANISYAVFCLKKKNKTTSQQSI